jgi:hypothetical protein
MFFPNITGPPEEGYRFEPNGDGGYSAVNAYDGPVRFFEDQNLGYQLDGVFYPMLEAKLIKVEDKRAIP